MTYRKLTRILRTLLICGAASYPIANTAAIGQTSPSSAPTGMVSINFDDGKMSAFQNAIPILDAANLKSTQYIITGFLGTPGYIGVNDLLTMVANGHEIGGHSRTHGDLRVLLPDRLATEIAGSREDLIELGVMPGQPFAYPSGYSNTVVAQATKDNGFFMGRLAGGGMNLPASADLFGLLCVDVTNTVSVADVEYWITKARDQKQWLILLFHDVDNTGSTYSTSPYLFQQIVDYITAEKVPVVTMSQALHNIQQLKGIKSQPPTATVSNPNTDLAINVGDSVAFQGSAGPIPTTNLEYRWRFGSGSGIPDSTVANPGEVQFLEPGVFTVEFTITDVTGLSTTATRIITVLPTSPSVIPNHNWKIIYVDSQQATYEAGKAIDGTARFWSSAWSPVAPPFPHEIQFDLRQVYQLNGFRYLPRQDSSWGRVRKYEFYLSNDGVNWNKPIASGNFPPNDSAAQVVTFKKTTECRFIRFVALSSVGDSTAEIAELNVIGTLADSAPTAEIIYPISDKAIKVGKSLNFLSSATVQNANSAPLTWTWNIKSKYESATLKGQNPGYFKFNTIGLYTVSLHVTDAMGRSSKVSKRTIDVQY